MNVRKEFPPNQKKLVLRLLFFYACIGLYAAFYQIFIGDRELKRIKESPVCIVGEVIKGKTGKGGTEVDYEFVYEKKIYHEWQILSNKEYYLLKKIPFKALIVLNRKDPNDNRMVIDQDMFKEFHIPNSIMEELNSHE